MRRAWFSQLPEKGTTHLPSPNYVAVPDEAMRRRSELSHGAWSLYEQYCSHRNRDTGRCDPSLELLAVEMRRTYTHISNMKTELVREGWIRRTGRHAVELLVGAEEFPPPKVRPLVRKNPNEESASLGKILTPVRKNPNEESASPYTDKPLKEPDEAAAAAAGRKWKRETCDAAYIAEVKGEGIYPAELVDYVWRKLQATCRRESVRPTKGRLAYWLSTERGTPPVQPTLPLMGAPVVEGQFEPGMQDERLRPPDPECVVCFGAGMEVVKGKGARRCKCRQIQEPASEAATASDELEREAQSG
jgi:hypothetical protein